MNIKLQLASLISLGILSGFLAAILLAATYFAGFVSAWFIIIFIIAFNAIMWLVSPYISDLVYRWFYKIQFYQYEDLKDEPYMKFIKKVCDEHNMKVPKFGIIPDQNPTAFTYGSGAFNARVVVTEGLFNFLNEDELEAVLAHELGHIVNKDFIIMTIAATLLQVLYEMYVIFTKSRTRGSALGKRGSKNDSGGGLAVVGIISYIFYLIGTYIVLYLSRLREYYADEFSAKKIKDPNVLSSALIKVAYGIASVPDTEKTAHLLSSTRTQGIFDFKAASDMGLIYQNAGTDRSLVEKALLFDIVSPWAGFMELSSTHPLVGKRIRRLSALSSKPAFHFDNIMKQGVDKGRLWGNFFRDLLVSWSFLLTLVAFVAVLAFEVFNRTLFVLPTAIVFIAILAAVSFMNIKYRYPMGAFPDTDVIHCMADIYASPIKGRPLTLSGKAIGRGQAGFIFGEDMMFQDKTGIIYLNYESGIPFIGNLLFAWKKLEQFLGQPASAEGWFLRGATHHIDLNIYQAGADTIKSYVRTWAIVWSAVKVIFVGLVILFFVNLIVRPLPL